MAFSKIEALPRKIATLTCEGLWEAVGNVCRPFTLRECMNHLAAAGYDRH